MGTSAASDVRAGASLTAAGAVLRAATLPFDVLLRWSGDPGARNDLTADTLAADRAALRKRLRSAYDDPLLREAVTLASPQVAAALERWRADSAPLEPRMERTLVSYLLRAAGRCTPFGLFAGCGAVELGLATRLELGETGGIERRSRLDFGYLDALTTGLLRELEERAELVVRPNSLLYPVAGRWRHAVSTVKKGTRHYHLAATDRTRALDAALRLADGGTTGSALARALAEELTDLGITPEQAAGYVGDLVDAQLLVPAGGPPVTGDPRRDAVLDGLPDVPAVTAARMALHRAGDLLADLDAHRPGTAVDRYPAVADTLRPLPAPIDPARLVQVDVALPTGSSALGPDVLDALREGAELLARISTAGSSPITAFGEALTARHEARFIPLLEALDAESGVGYPPGWAPSDGASPLVDGLPLPRERDATTWTDRDEVLLRLLTTAIADGRREVRLGDGDVADLSRAPPPLPDAFHVLATVCAPAADDGDARILLRDLGGPSGAALLGRFSHLTPGIRAVVDRHVAAEERPGACYAEVVHLPQGRIGNIVARPVLRDWEIPFLGRSGAPADRQLGLDDLWVGIAGGRVVLRSARLDAEVVPRMTTAYHTAGGLAVYRFLHDLQFQDAPPGLEWSWGPLASAPFLPRVVRGRTVLARARWRVEEPERRRWRASADDLARVRAVRQWRDRVGAPRWVALVDGDNELVLDLDNVVCVEILSEWLNRPDQRERAAMLVELFPGPDGLCLDGPGGRHVHELLVPFAPQTPLPARPLPRPQVVPRTFPPGSEWLYLRLYGGEASTDRVLLDTVGPLTAWARGEGLADRWFFLRYADPEPHLRVRWRGRPERLTAELLPTLHRELRPLLDEGLLRRVDAGTYEREIERYGGPAAIELAEQVFEADSDAVLALLDTADGAGLPEARWRLALAGADLLLRDLQLADSGRRDWARDTRAALLAEHGGGADLARELGRRFRPHTAELADLLDGHTDDPVLKEGLLVLRARSERLAPLADRLARLHDRTEPMAGLARSLVHMHVNRMIRSGQRLTELVLADRLDRLYRSAAARAR